MNIYNVRDNLKKTIEGKEAYLQVLDEKAQFAVYPKTLGYQAMADMLEININELKVILFDVEKCCEQYTLMSWEQNPDRSGGQFTQDEIDNAGRWQ